MLPRNEVEQAEERFRRLTTRTYLEYSILPSVVTIEDFDVENPVSLEKFAQRIMIDHWLEPDYVHDILFHDLGRIVGLSERKFIVDQLSDNTVPHRGEINLGIISEAIGDMVRAGHSPTAILMPIELYQEMHTTWDPSWRSLRFNPDRLALIGNEIRIFWSNKFMPFKNAYLVSPHFGIWVARPSGERRLQVTFRPTDQNRMDVVVQTLFNFRVAEPQAVQAFEIPNLPEELG